MMKSFLQSLLKKLVSESPSPAHPAHPVDPVPTVGQVRPTDEPVIENESYYPPSFRLTRGSPEAPRPELFDPALKQFDRAFRHGEPVFDDLAVGDQWRRARRFVINRLVATLATSEARERLVLRGSLLMKLWLGERARTPGDVDWVVLPPECRADNFESKQLFAALVATVRNTPSSTEVRIIGDKIVVEDIWAYDRRPGKRLLIPWEAVGLPPGTVQMDFVFGEPVPGEPEWIDYPTVDGGIVKVQAATREASLIWKLVWLHTDMYPQGKDLFDAVLLARTVVPRLDALCDSMLAHDNRLDDLDLDFPLRWTVDWKNFLADYPATTGTAEDWQRELTALLRPMFEPQPPSGVETL